MTKPAITTRAAKGAALTYSELDTNFTNLRDATLTVKTGTDSKALDLNDTLEFIAGTNITLGVDLSTGALTINSTGGGGGTLDSLTDVVISSPSTGQILKYNGALGYWQNSTGGYLTAVGEDVAPMLGGNLSIGSKTIYSSLTYHTQTIDMSTDALTISSYDKNSPTKGTSLELWTGPQNGINLTTPITTSYKPPIGLIGNRVVVGQPSGDTNHTAFITTNSTGTSQVDLVLNTGDVDYLSGTSANIRIASGTNGSITLTPNGTGSIVAPKVIASTVSAGTGMIDSYSNLASYANNATVDFANFSGMIIINRQDVGSGNVALWIVGSGGVLKLGDSIGNQSGTITAQGSVNGYRWTNNTGGTISASFAAIRTRTAG